MQTLTWADHRKISEFVRDLYCLDSVKAIFERVVQRLDTLIGGNSTIMILNESKADAPRILAENAGPEYQKLLPTAWALRHEHPGIRYHLAHRGRAVALADLLPLNQSKKTGLKTRSF